MVYTDAVCVIVLCSMEVLILGNSTSFVMKHSFPILNSMFVEYAPFFTGNEQKVCSDR